MEAESVQCLYLLNDSTFADTATPIRQLTSFLHLGPKGSQVMPVAYTENLVEHSENNWPLQCRG